MNISKHASVKSYVKDSNIPTAQDQQRDLTPFPCRFVLVVAEACEGISQISCHFAVAFFITTISSSCLSTLTVILRCQCYPVRVSSSGLGCLSYVFGNVAWGGGQRVKPLEWARGQGWVQEREFERKSSRTVRGFQKVNKTGPKQGVPGQLSLSPSTIVTRGSPGNSASIGGP